MFQIKAHLKEANKGYFQHGKFAIVAGFDLILTGIVSIIHGIFPNILPFYAEKKVDYYHKKALQLQALRKQNK